MLSRYSLLTVLCARAKLRAAAQIQGVAPGHVETLQLTNRSYALRTLSMRPRVFLIEDFLTASECEQIIALAGEHGMQTRWESLAQL